MPKCIVIGGGFGGIASALRMRAKGYDVTLIDKQDKLGGRAYAYEKQTEHGTFKHDAGPTVITAKFLFDELFELFGKRREDYVEFRDIYPWYRIVFAGEATSGNGDWLRSRDDERDSREDANAGTVPVPISAPISADCDRKGDRKGDRHLSRGTSTDVRTSAGAGKEPAPFPHFDYGGTMEQFEAQIRKFGGDRDVEGFRQYLAHSKRIFDVGFTELGDQPFDKFTTMLRCAPDLVRLGCYKTVYQMGAKYIKDDKLRRVFSFQPLLVGGNPFNTTCIYSLIFYLEREWGVQFAMGGTGAIVRGLEKLMEEEGIEVRLGYEVKKIDTCNNGNRIYVDGIYTRWPEESDSDWFAADKIVVNGDPPQAYRNLIHADDRPKWTDTKIDKLKYSMGLFVLYFGTTRQYPDVAHHTIVLGEAYKDLLKKLFDDKAVEREDLSVYLHRPTATDPSMAPDGMDSFYVLVPVPNLQPSKNNTNGPDVPTNDDGSVDWSKFGDAFRDDVVRYLERTVLPGLSDCITGDFYVTPNHFRDNLNTHYGTGFSVQPIFRQSAWFRFHNKSDIDGLYFVGAGTHPGAGMPGVLCSAKVVDRLIPAVGGGKVSA